MKLILLLPILIYLALMLVNMNLLQDSQTINLFGAQDIQVPVFMFSSFFIVVYAVLVYLVYSGINSFQAHKIRKLDREIVELKSDLYDNQKELLEKIEGNFEMQFQNFKKDNALKFDTMIRFNEYTLEKVLAETDGNFDKYRKETEKLLAEAKWLDKGILEKLKVWKK